MAFDLRGGKRMYFALIAIAFALTVFLAKIVFAITPNSLHITTIAVADLTPDHVLRGQAKVPLMTFTIHTKQSSSNVSNAEKFQIAKIKYTGTNKNDVSTLYLYTEHDVSGGTFDPSSDIQLGSDSSPTGAGEFTFNLPSEGFLMNNTENYQFYIAADIASGATLGNLIDVKIEQGKLNFVSGTWPNSADAPLFDPAGNSIISGLANLTVTKIVINNNGGTKVVGDFTLKVDNAIITSGVKTSVFTGAVPSIHNVSEVSDPGYKSNITGDCAADGSVSLGNGDNKVCTITNDDIAPKLTITKVVVNDNGGTKVVEDFPLFVDSGSVTSGVQNTFSAGSHQVSETQDSSYTSTITGDCAADGNVTLNAGDVKSCTITNDDKPPQITLIKNIINDDGGNAGANDFGLSIGGNSVNSGDTVEVNANTPIEINEAGLSGYDFVSITGDGCTAELGETVTLSEGQEITCTITNDDIAPTL
ncbi:MAG: hypothetical protein HYS80_01495, partial [Candidatus Aenigmarchaeota archaeon]|nr:hypothetical protein [Candidatus Aenigmarchaeota archaeon]